MKKAMGKAELEHDLNLFFSQAMGDSFKTVHILESDFNDHGYAVYVPSDSDEVKTLDYDLLPIKIEMVNGKTFTLTASEWAQITIN